MTDVDPNSYVQGYQDGVLDAARLISNPEDVYYDVPDRCAYEYGRSMTSKP